jgi:hypothetical protein
VVATALVATAVWGCGGGGGEDVVAEPATATAAKTEVEQAYLAYWDMVGRLEREKPGQDAEIADRATGPALVALTSQMAMLELSGQLNLHEDGYEHQVLSVEVEGTSATEAVVRDCFVDDTTLVDRETLEPVTGKNDGVTTQLLEVRLVVRDTWQVQEVVTVETFEGATPESCTAPSDG